MDTVQLKNTITDQEKTIKKYEQKLRDLIEAYKTISKEKELLESTLKSLIDNKDVSSLKDDSEQSKLNSQINTLSNAIATLTEEKRKMERNYLDDRKVLRGEYETNLLALRTELESQSIVIKQLNSELNDLRAERSKSNEELKQQVTQLISDKEKLKLELNEGQDEILEKSDLIKRLNEDCNHFRTIRNDLEQEIAVMKHGYESRVAFMEEVIADLSKNIGQMEHQHIIDEDIINKLSDKLKHATTTVTSVGNNIECVVLKDSQCDDTPDILQFSDYDKILMTSDVNTITEKMSQLQTHLLKLDPNYDVISFLIGESKQMEHPKISECTGECQTKIKKLKEELEYSQLSMQNFMKMNSNMFSDSSYQQREIDRLKSELSVNKLKISKLQDDLSNLDINSNRNMKNLKDEILKTEWDHKQELTKVKQEHNQIVLDLQSELTKHRNRTINLLAEKDNEIKTLQKSSRSHTSNDQVLQDQLNSDEENEKDPVNMRNVISCPLYQCCEMKARMKQELKKLRQGKRELVMQIHKLESEIEYVKSDWKNEINILTVKLQRAESINKLSSSVNMEYLRNVLVRFLSTSDPSCRFLMAKAIGKVLQFSSEELSFLNKNTWK